MIGNVLIFIIALLPVVILGCYIYSKDRDKEPIKMIVKLFIGGLLSALLSICLSFGFRLSFGNAFEGSKTTFFNTILYSFVYISFIG